MFARRARQVHVSLVRSASDFGPAAAAQANERLPDDGLTLAHFVGQSRGGAEQVNPALPSTSAAAPGTRSVFVETYGCQMNTNDTEVVLAVLQQAGYGRAATAQAADVVLLNTCVSFIVLRVIQEGGNGWC